MRYLSVAYGLLLFSLIAAPVLSVQGLAPTAPIECIALVFLPLLANRTWLRGKSDNVSRVLRRAGWVVMGGYAAMLYVLFAVGSPS